MPPKHRAHHTGPRLRSALVATTTGPLALAAFGALAAPTAQAAPTTNSVSWDAGSHPTTGTPAAAPAPRATAPAAGSSYTVVPGDTLSEIATVHHSTVAALVDANHLAAPDVLAVGQRLTLADGPAPQPRGNAKHADTADAPHAAVSGVVGTARTWIGTAYRWGGNTRSGVDCSGLTSQVFSANGTNLPRTADAQMNATTRITRDQARPGDLVFGVSSDGTAHHVGIYLGGGRQIDAPTAGSTVGVHQLYRDQTVFGRVR